MKEGLEFAREATREKRDAIKRKVLSEVSHDPAGGRNGGGSSPSPLSILAISAGEEVSVAPVNGMDTNSLGQELPLVGLTGATTKVERISPRRHPLSAQTSDPDSTTLGGDSRQGGDASTQDVSMVDEGVRDTQSFTHIKDPGMMKVDDRFRPIPIFSIESGVCSSVSF